MQVSAPAVPGRRGPRRATTEDEILDAALALLDEGGAAAVSIRGIAGRVGVAPNAVYTYFPDKAAVVKALVERLLSQVNRDAFVDRAQPWRLRVEALALELRQRLTTHSGVVPLMISAPVNGPQALALHEALLDLLADAGLSPADAPRTSYLLFVYMLGSIVLLVADAEEPGALPSEAEWVAARGRTFAGTPAEPYPRAAAAAASRAAYISREQYLWGLHRLLDGIALIIPTTEERRKAGGNASA
jgi:TetR/AcrR family tetracycline transcriptional repressor